MEWWLICVLQVTLLTTGSCIPPCTHYLNRRREGVFHYDRHTRYQLTYYDAQHVCAQDFGAELATRDQLLQALLSGLEECRAGWITLAEVAYPRINNRWNCGFNKTGIISYGIRQNLHEKWDVFCYKENDDCSNYNKMFFGNSPETMEKSTIKPTPTSISTHLPFSVTADPSTSSLKSSSLFQTLGTLLKTITTEPWKAATLKPHGRHFENNNSPGSTSESLLMNEQTVTVNTKVSNHFQEQSNQKEVSKNVPTSMLFDTTSTQKTEVQASSVQWNTSLILGTMRPEIINDAKTTMMPSGPTSGWHDQINPGEDSKTNQINATKEKEGLYRISLNAHLDSPIFNSSISESANSFISEPSDIQINTTSVPSVFSDNRLKYTTSRHGTNMPRASQEKYSDNPLQTPAYLNNTSGPTYKASSVTSESRVGISFSSSSRTLKTNTTAESILKTSLFQNIYYSNNAIPNSTVLNNAWGTNRPYWSTSQSEVYQLTKGNKIQPQSASKNQTEVFTIKSFTVQPLHLQDKVKTFAYSENKGVWDTTPTTTSGNYITGLPSGKGRQESFKDHLSLNGINKSSSNKAQESMVPTVPLITKQQAIIPVTYTQNPVTTEHARKSLAVTQTGRAIFFTASSQQQIQTGTPTPEVTETNRSKDACGGLLKGLSGQFESPGFPQSYDKDMNCTWVIEAPSGYYLILEFVSIVLEGHRNCEYDYVLLYDGIQSDNHVLGRFCGSQHPHQVRASSNVVTVIMRSDSTVEFDGFSLRYSTIQSTSGIHLVKGKSVLEGAIEIDYQGLRGSICPKLWSNKEAKVICRQLGFYGPAIATRFTGEEKLPWAISFVNCSGSEAILENCNVRNSGGCGTTERAGVICEVYESCAALKNAGVQQSGIYVIDPDGVDQGEGPISVECDMVSDSKTGITIVGHDTESKKRVTPCKEPGCYSRIITYKEASLAQLTALISISENCEQFVKLDCRHIKFLDGPWGWWVSRDGDTITSWGGASTNSGRCSCGENDECAFEIPSCNCDANDDVWRTDEGVITDKPYLPIREIKFGGIEDTTVSMAIYRIGKLRCGGTISEPPVLESCAAIKEAGITESGRYIIDPDGVDKGLPEFEVFCDMSAHSGITVVGHNSERRMSVSPCEHPGCYKREVTYSADLAQLNALTKVSQSCEQFVRLDCRHVRFMQTGLGWWESWQGKRMDYWGGGDPATGGCACGKTGTCASPKKVCNCDSNDNIWRTDDGFLLDKTALPIKAVYFGDTNDYPLGMAYHTIGKLRCRGKAK